MDFEDESECLSNLLRNLFSGLTSKDIADGTHQYTYKKSSCYRKRWLTMTKLPASLNALVFDNDLFKNTLSTGKRFLLIDCEEDGQSNKSMN